MATQSVATEIKTTSNDLSLGGVLNILTKRTTRAGDRYNCVGDLTNEELLTLSRQLHAIREASVNGLRTFGNVLSSYDKEGGDLDTNGAGWLVLHLAEMIHAAVDIGWSADDELAQRGFSSNGYPLRGRG